MRRQRAWLTGLLLSSSISVAFAGVPRPASDALAECRRDRGTLTQYLLCLDLTARRADADHASYYAELEELDRAVLRRLPDDPGNRSARGILPRFHHAERKDAGYAVSVTLVDVLDRLRADSSRVLQADCDLFAVLNAGVAERYYAHGGHDRAVGILRPRQDHLMNASIEHGRLTGLLETVDGSLWTLVRGQICRPSDDARSRWACLAPSVPLRPMAEDEVVALYLANIGLAVQMEGGHAVAMSYFDAALALNREEFVAHLGRALALLIEAGDWAQGGCEASRALLAEAESSALAAAKLGPGLEGPYSLLGRIELRGCAPQRAQSYLERAIAIRSDPLDHYYLALALEAQSRHDEAIDVARAGKRRIADLRDPAYRTLDTELDYLLALTHASRAESMRSARDLRKAMDYLAAVAPSRPEEDAVLRLESWIDRIDRRIGPVRRDFGLPRGLRRGFDASLAK